MRPASDDKTVHSRKVRLEPGRMLISAHTQVTFRAGGGEGQFMAVILYDGKPYPDGADLCAPVTLPCEVITVNGVPIMVTREHDAERGEVISAVRYLDGGHLFVSSAQGLAPYVPDGNRPPDAADNQPGEKEEHRPPLAAPPLTAQQVAALAADPAMLP
ncbi:hypothetical protein ACFQ1L_10155 [Phytohabitans flavus]|uniref:hypothetical protein n=1 Tax=Phytohabitans flavus TaxID=1076124 RepID=UPI003629C9CE